MKKGIRYLRFSNYDQSRHSIERQDFITSQWTTSADVEIIDTFRDEGYSAKTFDRPDVKALFSFIKKNHREIDYLIVSELTRFSRITGDAINMVMKIQKEYGIKIVSAGRGMVYDVTDHSSYFMMGLEFLLGDSENIKRQNDINWGIYSAKAIKGKYIHGGAAPYGYVKVRSEREMKLVIDEEEAQIIRNIYDLFLKDVPIYKIQEIAISQGFPHTGNSSIHRILKNPLYSGYQKVKAWKTNPGGMFPVKNAEPIIDQYSWNRAQEKFRKEERTVVTLHEDIPLRGLLQCHCGRYMTGAASRGKTGQYYYYYRCRLTSKHNNISAIKAHEKLLDILKLISLPEDLIQDVRTLATELLNHQVKVEKQRKENRNKELAAAEKSLRSVEEKWINNSINQETYSRWHSDLTQKIQSLKLNDFDLGKDKERLKKILNSELNKLSDLSKLYESSNVIDKRTLLSRVFNLGLIIDNGSYRTLKINPLFNRNVQKMSELGLLKVAKKGIEMSSIPSGGAGGIRTLVQT